MTGYATSLDSDDSVREYFPSQYRCLPGVMAAVPADMRGHDLFDPSEASGSAATAGFRRPAWTSW